MLWLGIFRAVFPRLFEAVAQASITVLFESLEGEGWTSDVAANSLEPLAIAAIDGDARVDVYAIELDIRTTGVLYSCISMLRE